ncbi:MAG: TIGR02147 family protein [Chitinivibrionales bacterium]|nr:TIGR02147 family protein [Chitinivibrionales bacterium]
MRRMQNTVILRTMKKITEYLDYRQFLSDFYEYQKSITSFFSLRYLGSKLNMDASLVLKVMQGKRHLSRKTLPLVCSLCNFDKQESRYFEALVGFNKARTDKEIKEAFEYLISLQGIDSHILEEKQYCFYQRWYHTAIRAVLSLIEFRDDFPWLARILSPAISVAEAKKSVALLERIGLIRRDEHGVFQLAEKYVSTGEKWRSVAVKNFQRESLRLAAESLDRHPKEQRDISTATVTLDKQGLEDAREMIRRLRSSVLKRAVSEKSRVYNLTIALHPLTEQVDENEA